MLSTRVRTLITGKATIHAVFWSVLAAAFFGAILTQPPVIYDEGLIVSGAARILHGQVPYRDFNTGYPPAQFYTIAGVFSAFGTTLLAERIWDLVWRLAIVAFAVVLARAAIPRKRTPVLPLICAGLVTGSYDAHLYPMISAMLPCFAAVWCAVLYLNQRGKRWLFFSGVAAGAAVLYRHDLAACVGGAVILAICYQAMAGRERKWLQFLAIFAAGVLLVVAMPVLYFWLSVPHDALAQSFIVFPRMTFAGRYLPLHGPVSIRGWHDSILAWRDFYLPLAIIVAATITLRRIPTTHRATIALLWMTAASTLALTIQRVDRSHAYPAFMFSMVLLCACIAEWQLENRTLLKNLILFGVICCYGVLPLYTWVQQLRGLPKESVPPGIVAADLRYSRDELPKIARAGSFPLAFDERQAIGYIQQHLLPGKPLYVGVETHGLGWYNDALFYFLADRPQATRFDMFAPGVTTSAVVQSEMLRDIRQKKTEYIVLLRLLPSPEPNLSSVDSGVRILDDAIRQDCTQVAAFGRYTIWRRKNR